mmetsp:Transcript_26530/g.32260  ORF Transcript_26530/g.32260 Transcript_26530/m.32260 type:complete len:172 (+) Transcript_26530:63-578(+)
MGNNVNLHKNTDVGGAVAGPAGGNGISVVCTDCEKQYFGITWSHRRRGYKMGGGVTYKAYCGNCVGTYTPRYTSDTQVFWTVKCKGCSIPIYKCGKKAWSKSGTYPVKCGICIDCKKERDWALATERSDLICAININITNNSNKINVDTTNLVDMSIGQLKDILNKLKAKN